MPYIPWQRIGSGGPYPYGLQRTVRPDHVYRWTVHLAFAVLLHQSSRTKWQSTSISFMRPRKTGSEERYLAPYPCYHTIDKQFLDLRCVCYSLIKCRSHINSTVAFVIALYSASVLDRHTIDCFLAHPRDEIGAKQNCKPRVDYTRSSPHWRKR